MQLNVFRFGLVVGFVLIIQSSFAQLQVRNINRIPEGLVEPNQARLRAEGDTISLPFWDDFSFSSVVPDSRFWESNTGALINGTLGKASPTLNVVSFDGSDLFGNPHDPSGVNSQTVDVLTSKPIDLGSIPTDKWDSVYFSFYWQMGGWAEAPEQRDSLKVDFLDVDGEWNEIEELRLIGIEENFHDTFTKAYCQLEEKYLHGGFQFRFRSSGNSLGPYDTWHIDYVYLNIDRHENDESLRDRAFAGIPTSIFSQYTMIPYDVLFDYPDTIYRLIDVELSNFINDVAFVDIDIFLRDTVSNIILFNPPAFTGKISIPKFGRNTFTSDKDNKLSATNLLGGSTDSLFLELEMIYTTKDEYFVLQKSDSDTIYLIDDGYNYKLNDTVRTYHEVHNTLAYDDGSAEYAAGLNKNESQLAIFYNLPSEDTLTSIDIHFPQFSRDEEQPVSPTGKRIELSVLKDLSGSPNAVLRSQEFVITGGSPLNQFERFTLDLPVILSDEFYISIKQYTNEYIGIGLDNNNLIGTQKLFVNLEDEWTPNVKVEGIVMVRAIFEDSDFVVANVDSFENDLRVFPNPVSDELAIHGNFDQYELLDLSGKILKSGVDPILSVYDLRNGIYFLKIRKNESFISRKIVVSH